MVKSVKPVLSENARKEKRQAILTKVIGQSIIWIFLILMYVPILFLIAFSFTNHDVLGVWNGFSFDLYVQLFHDEEILAALANTIILAIVSSLISTVLGTCGAIGVFYSKKKWTRSVVENVTQIPVVNAEIVIAMSLVVMFVFVGSYIFGGANLFSFWTLLIGHIILEVPFVYLSVKPKLIQMDPALYEAAMDLGCTQNQALWKTTMPEIMPGVASGFLLSITLSLDDFIVTAFTRGAGLLSGDKTIETLSTLVQAKIKKGPIPPAMRALTTIIFIVVLIVAILITIHRNVQAKKVARRAGR
ncbi:MAG: ABC transporter permease [Bacilli bacterium]|nr:ABC transporter permease [Bacilli bacterium]